MAEKKKPVVRFAGFNSDWEQRKLGEVSDRYDNLRVPISATLRVTGSTPYYGANGIQDYVEGFTHEGEFVLVAEDGANDLKNYPVKCVKGRIWVNNHAHVLQGKQGICDNQFLTYSINQADIESLLVGGGRAKLNAETMMSIDLCLPSLAEQIKIGRLTTELDNLITLYKRKCDKLKNMKKSMLKKMFPKNGCRLPEIRFAGFTDDWEQRKLGEVANFSKGQGYTKSDLKDSGTPIILYGRLYTKYQSIIREVNTFSDVIDGAVLSKGGEVILPSSGETAEDIAIASSIEKSGFLLGGGLNIVLPNKEIKSSFLAIELSFGSPHTELAKRAQGKSIVHLYNEDLKKVVIPYPSIEEQTKISIMFEHLDNLINHHQRELEKLQNIKKSCLEKMFV